jgi:hypothetical protein
MDGRLPFQEPASEEMSAKAAELPMDLADHGVREVTWRVSRTGVCGGTSSEVRPRSADRKPPF